MPTPVNFIPKLKPLSTMKLTRRSFFNTAGLVGASALATGGIPASALAQSPKPRAPRILLRIYTNC